MRSVPRSLKMHVWRVESTATTVRLAVGPSGRTLTFDSSGKPEPHPCTVRKPGADARSDVTVRASAWALDGTEAGTGTRNQQPAGTGTASRVSTNRAGLTPWNPPTTPVEGAGPLGAVHDTVAGVAATATSTAGNTTASGSRISAAAPATTNREEDRCMATDRNDPARGVAGR